MIEYLSQRRVVALTASLVLIAVLIAGLFALWPGRRARSASLASVPRSAGPSLNETAAPDPEPIQEPVQAPVVQAPRVLDPSTPDRPVRPQNVSAVSVRFAPGLSATDIAALGREQGFRVVERIPQIGWTVVEPTRAGLTPAELAAKLTATGVADVAQPAVPVYPSATPTDARYGEQWGFRNTAQSGGLAGADANAEPAWDRARGDDTIVAVIDTGVDLEGRELTGKAWVNPLEIAGNGADDDGNGKVDDVNGWDYVNDEGTVFDAKDGDKHGTHVAGTIGANTNNGVAGAGMAPQTSIMALKFLGPVNGLDTDGAAAIVYAVTNGADVINCSWGGSGASQVLVDAIAFAASRGVLVVAAAGNNAVNADLTPFYPAAIPATNVVSVAALTRTDTLASFSNWGATSVDIGAPGANILSCQPALPGVLFVDRAPYRAAYFAFPIESITSDAVRDEVVTRSMAQLATSTSEPVLLVDDSWSASLGQATTTRRVEYSAALAAAGYTDVTVHSTAASGTPVIALLQGKTVVWFTGAATLGWASAYMTLTTAERTVLASYLDGGGRLLLSSGDLGYDTDWVGGTALAWYQNYLRAKYVDDDPWTGSLAGRSSGSLGGLSFQVVDPIRTTDGFDDVSPLDAYAVTLADWDDSAVIGGTSMAAPHVTGALALAYSRTPTATATELKTRMLATAVPVAALAGKSVTGARLDAAALVGSMTAPAPLLVGPAGAGSNTLSWHDPVDDAYFDTTRVLVRVGADPTGPADASAQLLYEGTAQTATHAGIVEGAELHYAAYSRTTLGSWSAPATATVTFAAPALPGAPIPVGTGVTVTVGDVTLTFPEVTAPGWLSVTRIPPRETVPTGLRWINDGYYDIHPVGTFATPVAVTLGYDAADVLGPPTGLRLLHRSGGSWQPITTSVDASASTISGTVSSFSDFGTAENDPGAPEVASTPASSSWSVALLLFSGLAMVARVRARSVRRSRA